MKEAELEMRNSGLVIDEAALKAAAKKITLAKTAVMADVTGNNADDSNDS